MTADWWEKVRYFKPHEWGIWRSVEAELIFAVDELRDQIGKKCIIHVAFATSGHSSGSAHYRGQAVDLHFDGVHVVDQFLAAEKLGCFGGIGIYPHWNNPGLHLDIAGKGRRWLRDGRGAYLPLTWENIQKECK